MANVSLEQVTKRFPPAGAVAVDGISLEIFDREFLVLVGPSGCGKSTTLRLIAGLETCTGGTIRIGDRIVNDVASSDRDVAMVFQNYALYPHWSVYRNLSFGLKLRYGGGVLARGLRKIFHPRRANELARLRSGIDQQVRRTACRLGIDHLLDRKPHQLSGGERQRVALGRAIVRNPAAFLFDEPLSNLDAALRQQLRSELRRLHCELQTTTIYVTHDQVEAMALGDRIAVMNEGKILQVGQPLEVYRQPANLFVAQFMGNVPMNLISGTVKKRDAGFQFTGAGLQLDWEPDDNKKQLWRTIAGFAERQQPLTIGFRAEDMALSRQDKNDWEVYVSAVDQLGESTQVGFQAGSGDEYLVRLPAISEITVGQQIRLRVDREKIVWFDPFSGQNLLKEKS